jgi:hypothetical protein
MKRNIYLIGHWYQNSMVRQTTSDQFEKNKEDQKWLVSKEIHLNMALNQGLPSTQVVRNVIPAPPTRYLEPRYRLFIHGLEPGTFPEFSCRAASGSRSRL